MTADDVTQCHIAPSTTQTFQRLDTVLEWARGKVVTVAVNSFLFKQPVFIGDVLSFYTEIVRVGRTSITVNVEVYAQRNPADIETVKVTEATLSYVATGPDRKPRVIPEAATPPQ